MPIARPRRVLAGALVGNTSLEKAPTARMMGPRAPAPRQAVSARVEGQAWKRVVARTTLMCRTGTWMLPLPNRKVAHERPTATQTHYLTSTIQVSRPHPFRPRHRGPFSRMAPAWLKTRWAPLPMAALLGRLAG